MSMSGQQAAQTFIEHTFPQCEVAFLAGSTVKNKGNDHSDLDIVIIDETESSPGLECFFRYGWKIEAFVFNRMSLSLAFETSRLHGFPTITRMCAEGRILKDDGSAEDIQREAKKYMENGPAVWIEKKQQHYRFMITELLDDLQSPIDHKEKICVAYKLFDVVSEFVLGANGYWQGHGKWMYRSLQHVGQTFCDQYIDVFQTFMKTGESKPLCTFI